MSKARDILVGDDGDLLFDDGDFAVGDSDAQHVEDILFASPGHWKQNPLVGADVRQNINGTVTNESKRRIQLQLEADGYLVRKMPVEGFNLIIDAERK